MKSFRRELSTNESIQLKHNFVLEKSWNGPLDTWELIVEEPKSLIHGQNFYNVHNFYESYQVSTCVFKGYDSMYNMVFRQPWNKEHICMWHWQSNYQICVCIEGHPSCTLHSKYVVALRCSIDWTSAFETYLILKRPTFDTINLKWKCVAQLYIFMHREAHI